MNWTDDRNRPQARVLLDSISPEGVRLTTFEVTTHRFVLAEFNTHRVFSRNSASSRAIPFSKQVEKVMEHPAIPVEWRERQRGMQGGDLLRGEAVIKAKQSWLMARDGAVTEARYLHELGVHKSVVNRILEPFLWHNIIVTATEWDGFWFQRCSALAQPEIRVAAEYMKSAYDNSYPLEIDRGEWHTPLVQPDEDDAFWHHAMTTFWDMQELAQKESAEGEHAYIGSAPNLDSPHEARKAVSAARCARVSYLTHDGQRNVEADLDLYARLATASPGHWSPFEHVATPCGPPDVPELPERATKAERMEVKRAQRRAMGGYDPNHVHLGNLRGWDQYRHEVSTGANA